MLRRFLSFGSSAVGHSRIRRPSHLWLFTGLPCLYFFEDEASGQFIQVVILWCLDRSFPDTGDELLNSFDPRSLVSKIYFFSLPALDKKSCCVYAGFG
jgi:hypothetical protein